MPVAARSTLTSARPPRHAIASTSSRHRLGSASRPAATSPATSAWPRCARTAAASHRHRPPATASSPSRRSALSSSTVSYGLPAVYGSITPASPAAEESACSISATMAPSSAAGRFPSRSRRTPRWSRHRASSGASGCVPSTSPSRQAATSSRPAVGASPSSRSTKPSAGRPAHCRSSTNTTTGRSREATARSTCAATCCARTCAVSGSPACGGTPSSAANSGTVAASSPRARPRRLQDPPRTASRLLSIRQQQPAQRAERLISRVELQVPPARHRTCPPRTSRPGPSPPAAAASISAVLPTPAAPPTSTPHTGPPPLRHRRRQHRDLLPAPGEPRRR